MNTIIDTPDFTIRLFSAAEEEPYLQLFDDEQVTLYLPHRSREDLVKVFRENLVAVPGSICGRWGIFSKPDDDLIGMCLLRPFDDGTENIELGYVLHRKYWGKGIASAMTISLLNNAARLKPGTTFVAVTDLANVPSQRVLEKAGMERGPNYFRQDEELAFFWVRK